MTDIKQPQVNTVASNTIGLEPWAASYSIDNTTIENYVVNLFVTTANVQPIGCVLTDTQPGKTQGRDLQDTLSLTVFFEYEDFTGTSSNNSIGSLNPAIAAQMPLNTNVKPIEGLLPLLSRIGKVIQGTPAKYVVTPKQQNRGPLVQVTLDIHAVLRLILHASPSSFVIALMASESNRTGDQVILNVTKAIASENGNQANQANGDLRDLARGASRGGSRGFNNNSNNNRQQHSRFR